jgi:hypothetical protein
MEKWAHTAGGPSSLLNIVPMTNFVQKNNYANNNKHPHVSG